nr:uncharacterized protein LOC100222365 isoform X2 [Taeniopygia guttata]
MDFSSPFTLLCLLVIITVTQGSVIWTGALSGDSAVFSLEIQSLQNFSSMSKEDKKCSTTVLNDTLLAKCGTSASRWLNLENGSLVLRSVEKDDEGKYGFVFQNTIRNFTLEVFEPTIGIQCFPDGTAELSCNMASNEILVFRWLLNGTHLKAEGACIKDAGKKVHLGRTEPGEFVCEILKGNSVTRTRPITLSCSYDLLRYPGFIYILAGCAAGVFILVVALPAAICCCMKRRHKFIPVPSDAAQIGQGVEPQPLAGENLPVQIEAEEMPEAEVLVDMESQEDASDCFPDPTDD